jgi:hypothetical protein
MAQKNELCLTIAEEKFADVTTPQQRRQSCTEYAAATADDYDKAFNELIKYLDEQTPAGRLEFCKSRGAGLFDEETSQAEADKNCDAIANNWPDFRTRLIEWRRNVLP